MSRYRPTKNTKPIDIKKIHITLPPRLEGKVQKHNMRPMKKMKRG